jgi:glycosyltransferase involved in cell wall biosynthesis
MNVTLVSHSEEGGAGIAARRLFVALKACHGINASLVVREKNSWTDGIRSAKATPYSLVNSIFLAVMQWMRNRSERHLSHRVQPNFCDEGVALKAIEFSKPDIVNLHWLGKNFLSLHSIKKIGKPIVITLHDAWYLTGGCFQPGECIGYKENCRNCPLEAGNPGGQFSISKAHYFKQRAFAGKSLVIVSPSRWMANLVQTSSLTRGSTVEIIPNGIDCSRYKPQDKLMARSLFGLPEAPFFLLFGSAGGTTDPNKGFHILQEALYLLRASMPPNLQVIVFGGACEDVHFPVPIHFVGPVRDERAMSALYACADAVAVPSLHETFSLVTIESLACGRPVVAFANSGPGEIIEDAICGWLAPEVSPEGYAIALARCFADKAPSATSINCRKHAVDKYDINKVSKKYFDLFNHIHQSK